MPGQKLAALNSLLRAKVHVRSLMQPYFITVLQPGYEEYQIGVKRLMEIEGNGYVEEVRGLDDYAHEL